MVETIQHALPLRGTNASQQDNAGYTGLHYAARSGHLHIVRLLVQVEESKDKFFSVI